MALKKKKNSRTAGKHYLSIEKKHRLYKQCQKPHWCQPHRRISFHTKCARPCNLSIPKTKLPWPTGVYCLSGLWLRKCYYDAVGEWTLVSCQDPSRPSPARLSEPETEISTVAQYKSTGPMFTHQPLHPKLVVLSLNLVVRVIVGCCSVAIPAQFLLLRVLPVRGPKIQDSMIICWCWRTIFSRMTWETPW